MSTSTVKENKVQYRYMVFQQWQNVQIFVQQTNFLNFFLNSVYMHTRFLFFEDCSWMFYIHQFTVLYTVSERGQCLFGVLGRRGIKCTGIRGCGIQLFYFLGLQSPLKLSLAYLQYYIIVKQNPPNNPVQSTYTLSPVIPFHRRKITIKQPVQEKTNRLWLSLSNYLSTVLGSKF